MMCECNSELLAALKAADEALANVTAFEDDARYIMGNTNFEIVKLRREQVRVAICKAEAAQSREAPTPMIDRAEGERR